MKSKTKNMKKVNKYTKAGKDGKSLICPNCKNKEVVYHFSWTEIVCGGCFKSVSKYKWWIGKK
jgi:ribosomal protein S27E